MTSLAPGSTLRSLSYADMPKEEKQDMLNQVASLTGSIYPGLDVHKDIEGVDKLKLGDTILAIDGEELRGLAVCHFKVGSEATDGTAYVKFAAVAPSFEDAAESVFRVLVDRCQSLGESHGRSTICLGVNTSRERAYKAALNQGFKIDSLGVAMLKPNTAAFNRPDAFIIDDWRG